MKNLVSLLVPFLILGSCSNNRTFTKSEFNPLDYVNPFVGISGVALTEGNTIPATQVPFGMASIKPINLDVSDTGRCNAVIQIFAKPLTNMESVYIWFFKCKPIGNGLQRLGKYRYPWVVG